MRIHIERAAARLASLWVPPTFRAARRNAIAAVMTIAVMTSACATAPTVLPFYHWGAYEAVIYDIYIRPDRADPASQITTLTRDIEHAKETGQHVPPGVHAHLGYLYYGQERNGAACEQLNLEKSLYPESSVFVDGLLERMAHP